MCKKLTEARKYFKVRISEVYDLRNVVVSRAILFKHFTEGHQLIKVFSDFL